MSKATILANHAPSVRRRAELEYDVINAVITHCERAGFTLHSVFDGGELIPTATSAAALEVAFSVDESAMYFDGAPGKRYCVVLVMGNDGWDVVSDYTYDGGDDVLNPAPGTFSAAIEAATAPFAKRYG